MKLAFVGAGYVGLVAAACFAEMGNEVICVDVDEKRIEGLKRGVIPIFEPGLDSMVKRNHDGGRLKFTTSLEEAVRSSLVVFVAVGTPQDENGAADLMYVIKVARDIGEFIEEYKIVVLKSTVPVGTCDKVKKTILERLTARGVTVEFDVVSNPEFLKEGDAINDFMKPDRVVIGTDNVRTAELMKELYAPFAMERDKLIIMDNRSAEVTKYAANAMLATRISFMNEIANICERVGADVSLVRRGIGSDRRIGYSFIYPGIGYGGSCFPKDIRALINTAREHQYNSQLLSAVDGVNMRQRGIMTDRVVQYFEKRGGVKGRTVAVWGLSFKPNTDDVRESPAMAILSMLVEKGIRVQAYDPEAIASAKRVLGDNPNVTYFDSAYDALAGADALVLLTEWFMFRKPDFERVKKLLKAPVIFDGRNQYDPAEMKNRGFVYMSVGRK
ncbi:MAG TPA: UDP-glucose/GDP-mannose dehydrogenase family protein [Syntrophales bacterium]|nr:UDP-glucose/GDP-mannose dehydrogenase family protein [Syntrophales bacterium]HOX93868.1 UDP-glucose/GDP-mannose dehydrogenase family protein [Syntrophales bacterium]HPI56424.1 UDP-glucose/GDP-mannose dehydrogenase family protein [Syntrophales bacterium]HPN24188.1 UDP-glucose/GDP-mannose dehydrogenase family protein [Syntrophales bacterium]HQM28541.1 UDP-glucose/GDP-mannose dehydrogenase family protein [Syntrophales bacterium]